MGHGANATKANAPSLDGSSGSRHTYCGLSPATVDAQVEAGFFFDPWISEPTFRRARNPRDSRRNRTLFSPSRAMPKLPRGF